METLGDVFPREQACVREILAEYLKIGAVGRFGAAHIEQTLREADQAVKEGDTVAMLRLYAQLKAVQ